MSFAALMAGGSEFLAALGGQTVHLITGTPPAAHSIQARVHFHTAEELAAGPNIGLKATVRISNNHLPDGIQPTTEDRLLLSPPDPARDLAIQGNVILTAATTAGSTVLEVRS